MDVQFSAFSIYYFDNICYDETRYERRENLKNIKYLFVFFLLFSFITKASAATLTEEEKDRLRIIFSDARISVMSDEEAQKYLSYDLENTQKVSKYYKVTETTNGTTSIEVTKEEAENAFESAKTTRSTVHTTSYKNIQITDTHISGNAYSMTLINRWLVTPNKKSFDVMGMRTDDAYVLAGSQEGTQTYWSASNGYYDLINYSYNGRNMVIKDNGFGISMNLVDDASYFECDISATVIATTEFAKVFGTYQHAVSNVTLAQSQAYLISHNGLGGVLNFTTSVRDYYDGMQGVSIELEYNA